MFTETEIYWYIIDRRMRPPKRWMRVFIQKSQRYTNNTVQRKIRFEPISHSNSIHIVSGRDIALHMDPPCPDIHNECSTDECRTVPHGTLYPHYSLTLSGFGNTFRGYCLGSSFRSLSPPVLTVTQGLWPDQGEFWPPHSFSYVEDSYQSSNST